MNEGRHVSHRRKPIVAEIGVDRSSFFHPETFDDCITDTLGHRAFNLAFGAHGINDCAAIGGCNVLEHFDLAGLRIHLDLRSLASEIVCA